jgi:flagellar M-ring protein FliF
MLTLNSLSQLGSSLANFGPRRLALLGGVGLMVMIAVGIATHFLSRPAMQSIYTGLSAQEVGRMTSVLAEAGISFDINEQRNAVLVPYGQTARARTLLAQKGLPASARAGYELFDSLGSIGLTSFMQEVTRVRALEGEIARTVQALDGVAAARVHLVLPEQGSFRRERRDPSGSVLLRLEGRVPPATGQVVRHLVAAAVPGMKTDQVSVASTDGRLLVTGESELAAGSARLAEMERTMAAELEQKASRTLTSTLGSGNFQISITASLDVDRQQINETVFDPRSRVERSLRVVKQSGSSEDAAARAAAGADANVPREETSQSESERRRQREDRKEELINYELNSKTVQTVREGYRVKALAIAVVINRKQLIAQLGGSPDANAVAQRLEELKRLVAASTGSSEQRQDRIEISAADFSGVDVGLLTQPAASLMDYLQMNIGVIINALSMLGMVLIVVLLGVRPLIKRLSGASDGAAPAVQTISSDAGAAMPSLVGRSVEPSDASALADGTVSAGLPSGLGRSRELDVRARLDALVAANDVEVAKVLKSWMADARST